MLPKLFSFLFFFFTLNINAQSFIVGEGAEYNFINNNKASKLSIYISHSSFTNLGVEYYFSSVSGITHLEMWQQYHFKIDGEKNFDIIAAFSQTKEEKKPTALSLTNLSKGNGVRLDQFFLSKKEDLNPYKIGKETIEVPAGLIQTTHYRKKNNGQVLDFWISEQVRPIGLVKVVSKNSKESNQNYSVELNSLLKNVKPHIIKGLSQ